MSEQKFESLRIAYVALATKRERTPAEEVELARLRKEFHRSN
jgi:hypothetical protein